jgi:carbon-monoxide dehydrogenase large subunit
MASVRVIHGDTDAVPYGGGTYGSRAVAIGGEAVYQAARDLKGEILAIAGTLLQADIGHFQLAELPRGSQPTLSHTRRFHLADDLYIFTNGIHGAWVEVDVDTGFVRLLKHWVVEDCGRIINPQLADEQVRGGCVQGLGGALYEHCLYDEAGQLTNGTLADYLVPMAAEMPDIEVAHVLTLSSVSELGAKGVGESGTGAAPAVVMNAINDAIAPFSARVTTQPMTPEVILTALGRI